jgi:stress-induced morphogen
MYRVIVRSKKFQGKSLVEQHRAVNEALKNEFNSLHGVTLSTRAE